MLNDILLACHCIERQGWGRLCATMMCKVKSSAQKQHSLISFSPLETTVRFSISIQEGCLPIAALRWKAATIISNRKQRQLHVRRQSSDGASRLGFSEQLESGNIGNLTIVHNCLSRYTVETPTGGGSTGTGPWGRLMCPRSSIPSRSRDASRAPRLRSQLKR